MRKPSHVLLLSAAFALGAGTAGAATLSGSTVGISIGALPPILVPQNTDPSTLTVATDGSFNEPASFFGPTTIAVPRELFTGVAQISGLTLVGIANGSLPVTPSGGPAGGMGGVGPIVGSSLVNVIGLLNLTIPLSAVGSPGATVMAGAGGILITVTGNGWGTGPQTITGVTTDTPGTAVVNTVTFSGVDHRIMSFQQGGLQLVSAFRVLTNVAGNLPGLATQSLRFVPEPGSVLLVTVGGAVLALAAGLRRRRR